MKWKTFPAAALCVVHGPRFIAFGWVMRFGFMSASHLFRSVLPLIVAHLLKRPDDDAVCSAHVYGRYSACKYFGVNFYAHIPRLPVYVEGDKVRAFSQREVYYSAVVYPVRQNGAIIAAHSCRIDDALCVACRAFQAAKFCLQRKKYGIVGCTNSRDACFYCASEAHAPFVRPLAGYTHPPATGSVFCSLP